MEKPFDLQTYMTEGVERILLEALRATLRDPRETAFLTRFAFACSQASKLRAAEEQQGLHVPAFLIASITSACNLHCAGCYSRFHHATSDDRPTEQLTDEEWLRIFREAASLGVSFILLAGGEPLLRRGVIEAAGRLQSILFPVFTNGTFLDERYLRLFYDCRNLLPVLSIEGGQAETDARRGDGVYDALLANMDALHRQGLLFGASVTVTKENLRMAVSEEFVGDLARRGCKALFLVEFVPMDEQARIFAPDDEDRAFLREAVDRLRREREDLLFISFPGDEKSSGGCLAAGRGFFHINSHGGAEPCPFSPYSDVNVRDTSLREAIRSGLFASLRESGLLAEDHPGGCVLFERKEQVEALLREQTGKA